MDNPLKEMVVKRQHGIHTGIPSFCCANKIVIEAILDHVTIIDQSRVLLNTGLAEVSSRLAFRPFREGDNPLLVQQGAMGTFVVVPASEGEETQVDLEMLFNATLQQPAAIGQLFSK